MSITQPPTAVPRTSEQVAALPSCPEVLAAAQARGITDVLHFTTIHGAVGVLASHALKCRQRLPEEQYLEHVYRPNAKARRGDAAWIGYVNLSISRINDWMFDTSERWHIADGVSWVVLSFAPEILGHSGVVFATTNNIYPACRRAEGLAGFSQLFGDPVLGRYGQPHRRVGVPDHWPTDRQAEVLYPGEVEIRCLQRIDVQAEHAVDDIHGALGALDHDVPVRYAPEEFQ